MFGVVAEVVGIFMLAAVVSGAAGLVLAYLEARRFRRAVDDELRFWQSEAQRLAAAERRALADADGEADRSSAGVGGRSRDATPRGAPDSEPPDAIAQRPR